MGLVPLTKSDPPGGMAASVLDGTLRLKADGDRLRRFTPTMLDTDLLSVVEAAVMSGIPLGLVFPLAGTSVPLLVGATALVGMVRQSKSLRVSAALVAANLSSRMLYDRLCFESQRLADFIPRASIDPDGGRRVIGTPRRDAGGRFYVVSRLDRLESVVADLAVVVVDASAATASTIGEFVHKQ